MLQQLAFNHLDDGAVDKARCLAVVGLVEEAHHLCKEEVTHEDGGGVAPLGVDGGLSAARVGTVYDVVMQE